MKIYDGGIIFLLIIGVGYYFLKDEIKRDLNKNKSHYQDDYVQKNYLSGEPIKEINNDECQTEYTKHYTSKESGNIVTCIGDLLKDGQKTKHIYVRE